MKNSIKTIFGILLISILSISLSTAQERTSLNIHRTLKLENKSENMEVVIEVNMKDCRFNLKIYSLVQAGEVRVEIYDNEGKRQGNFSVGCQADSKNINETANGMITKLIENPSLGEWKVKILPQKATGTITIDFSQEIQASKI